MSSELHKYLKSSIEEKQNLFNANVIEFPNEKKAINFKEAEINKNDFWSITDKSNSDQFKAVTVICYMFLSLILMGLYSNLV